MTEKYNLLYEPWIAVVDSRTGKKKKVSLIELFENASDYSNLAGEMQTQNFAVLRFLLAVIQTVFSRYDYNGNVLPGIELDEYGRQTEAVDEDDMDDYTAEVSDTWNQLYTEGKFPEIIVRYLKSWQDHFYLFDDKYPFYQVNKHEMDEILNHASKSKAQAVKGRTINRTISESNNKPSLFLPSVYMNDRKELTDLDILSADEIVRWLIAYQGYSNTGDKVKYPDKSNSSKGWLYDIGGICLQGDSLFETLVMNYMPESPTDNERLTGRIQRPCWEYSGIDAVHRLRDGKPVDNLAELYTNWSRAVYMDPDTDVSKPLSISVVKLPEIDHSDANIEPMTLWKTVKGKDKQNHCMLKKHQAGEALWRSFGLIAVNPSDASYDTQRRPGIYSQYARIAGVKGSRWTNINGVSMKSDENATSWMPVDEITDQFRINDIVITDNKSDGWIVRISNAVETTKDVVSGIFRSYLRGICEIRGLRLTSPVDPLATGFIETETARLYDDIDAYFKEWLKSLQPEMSKDEAVARWYSQLKQLTLQHGTELFNNCTEKDLIGIEGENGCKNIATEYWHFINRLYGKLGKEKSYDSSRE